MKKILVLIRVKALKPNMFMFITIQSACHGSSARPRGRRRAGTPGIGNGTFGAACRLYRKSQDSGMSIPGGASGWGMR